LFVGLWIPDRIRDDGTVPESVKELTPGLGETVTCDVHLLHHKSYSASEFEMTGLFPQQKMVGDYFLNRESQHYDSK
jgi:hypothetical protein